MKKIVGYLAILMILILSSCNNESNYDNEIIKEINNTNYYLNKYELDDNLFSNILQMKLNNSLV